MIDYKLPHESFIGGWFIDEKVCDNLIKYYNNIDYTHEHRNKNNVKGCMLTQFHPKSTDKVWIDYKKELQKVLELYLKRYPEADKVCKFYIQQATNIQHYKSGGGYISWHFENDGRGDDRNRHLVFMTYLNDVNDGGTEFKYQKLITPARKGLTVIWPAQWTHTHRGVVNETQDKYIITGWFNYE